MSNQFQKSYKKILVTGGAGFIGSNLVNRLIAENYQVIVIDNLSTGNKENLNPKAKFYKIDICNPKIAKIFKAEKPEFIFHYAAQSQIQNSIKNPVYNGNINILGSLNILENCKKFGVKKIIFASTGAVYGEAKIIPTPEDYSLFTLSPYGITKLTIEKYLHYYWKIFDLPYVILRYSNVYCPHQNPKNETGVVTIFCNKMLLNIQPIINGDGKQTRDFIYINDAVEAAILALKKNVTGVFNIGTGKETSINAIFQKIKELTGSSVNEIHGPIKIGEQKRSCLDIKKAGKELSWQPRYSLDKGLKETVKYYKMRNRKRINNTFSW